MREAKLFQFGDWTVLPRRCLIENKVDGRSLKLEPRVMNVLVALCARPGEVLSLADLLRQCWEGVTVGENQVHKAISQLRRTLGDDQGEARYIENVRKRGYRTLAAVTVLESDARPVLDAWTQGSPYPGLDPFDETRAGLFFGREGAVSALLDMVQAQHTGGHALVLVLGASGSGKTSLIQAGLVPALRQSLRQKEAFSVGHLDLAEIGDVPLLSALGGALLDLEVDGVPLFSGLSADGIGSSLAGGETWRVPDGTDGGCFLLFVDRLEALFAVTVSAAERNRFLAALDRLAASGPFLVVTACRNDFYPSVVNEPVLMAAKARGGHFDLYPPNRTEISAMIQRPAALAGLGFELDPQTNLPLDVLLCDAAAGSPDALPLLQYTLQELYAQRSTRRELTIAAYHALGGVEGAIGRRADIVLGDLPEATRDALPRLLPMMITISPHDDAVRSRYVPWRRLSDDAERRLVARLVDERLFVSLSKDGEVVFGVAHEALLRQWPRVVDWIADHRQALNTRSRLEGFARRWAAEGRRADLLLPRGRLLEEARALADHPAILLNEESRALITASIRRARRIDHLRYAALAAFALIALVAGFFAVMANHAERLAAERQHQAEDLMNFMVGDFADKLRPLGRLELLSDVGRKALDYFAEVRPEQLTVMERQQQARALATIAEVARGHADPTSAVAALRLARQLLNRTLAETGESADLLKDLGANAFWLGQIALDQGRMEDAWTAFGDYRRHAERMMAVDPDNPAAWIELSYALNSLGSVAQARGDLATAAVAFEQSIALKRRALEKSPDDRGIQAGLANSLSWLGSLRQQEGALREALALFEQELSGLRALHARAPSENSWTYRLAVAMRRHAELQANLGDTAAAEQELQAARVRALDLTRQDPANRIWQRVLLNIDTQLGEVLANLGRLSEALALQRATADSTHNLTRQDPANREWQLLEVTNQIYLAQTLLRLGRAEEAQRQLDLVLDGLRAEDRTGDADFSQRLATALILRADVRRALGGTGEQECREAESLIKSSLSAARGNVYSHDLYVRASFCLGRRDQAKTSIVWLEKIGYRMDRYVRIISQMNQGEKP